MKISSWTCIPALLLILLSSAHALPEEKEKVEEGRYALLKNGRLVAGSEHSWTLWRLVDGRFELEDQFQVDKYSYAIRESLLDPRMPASPELRKSLQAAIEPSELSATFDPSRRLLSFTVRGLKLNGDKGVGLNCKTSSNDFECTGTSDKAKLSVHEPRELLWWYRVPLLLRSWITSPHDTASGSGPQKVVMLSFGNGPRTDWGDRPTLSPAELMIANLGPDTLIVGDKSFHAQKYRVDVKPANGDPLSLTVWTEAKGIILAVEDGRTPGDLVALTQYKSYSKLPSPSPTLK